MRRLLFVLVLSLGVSACDDPETAARVLKAAGYSDIKVGGFRMGCGDDDRYATRFSAKGPTGVPVTGVVCSGFGPWSKGGTIRLD